MYCFLVKFLTMKPELVLFRVISLNWYKEKVVMHNREETVHGGSIIRDLRIKQGLTLKKLSEIADVNYVFLSKLERGYEKPSEELVRRLAQKLDFKGDMNTLVARFGIIPLQVKKMILDAPDSVVDLPEFFKTRRRKK